MNTPVARVAPHPQQAPFHRDGPACAPMRMRFNAEITKAARDDTAKLQMVEELFLPDPFDEMRTIGVDLVAGTLKSAGK